MRRRCLALTVPIVLAASVASAEEPAKPALTYSINGYIEAAYTYDLQKPSNGIIDYRGFDNRHNTFTIQNAVVDAQASIVGVSARVALQVGRTPDTYYAAEPNLPGTSTTPKSSSDSWRFIQQAYAGYKTTKVARSLTGEVGIFLSPIGQETMAAKDSWNYSRSDLFFGLPFYHTGARFTLEVDDRLSIALWIVNGYNSVVDNNAGKSILSQFTYKIPDKLLLNFVYMGGPERPTGAPEGQPWRHLVDGCAQVDVSSAFSFYAQADTGFEQTRFGISYWGAGAIAARVHPIPWLYLAARGDVFGEHRGHSQENGGTASAMFFPTPLLGSGTFTIDGRPHDNVSVRLEYRHDQAQSDIFFAGDVKGDGTKTPYVPNAHAQDTITAAALAWF